MKKCFGVLMVSLLGMIAVSCSDDGENGPDKHVFTLSQYDVRYDAAGVWASWNTTQPLSIGGVNFARNYDPTYDSWIGFTPSKLYGTNYTSNYWTNEDVWGACVAVSNKPDAQKPFMLGYWDVSESLTSIPENPSCKISLASGERFFPLMINVTNSTVGYYQMLYGAGYVDGGTTDNLTAPYAPFGANDYCNLLIWGVRGGVRTQQPIKIELAKGTNIHNDWIEVNNLAALGEVDYIYLQMESSKTDTYGQTNASYFCIKAFAYLVQ